jgi:hypothetical protein
MWRPRIAKLSRTSLRDIFFNVRIFVDVKAKLRTRKHLNLPMFNTELLYLNIRRSFSFLFSFSLALCISLYVSMMSLDRHNSCTIFSTAPQGGGKRRLHPRGREPAGRGRHSDSAFAAGIERHSFSFLFS